MLGLVCNGWTQQLQWQDGSAVDYSPGLSLNFDCTKNTAVSRTNSTTGSSSRLRTPGHTLCCAWRISDRIVLSFLENFSAMLIE
ncbi:hypothetical protein PRIPAC_84620 [Pristionchus pacificus]|nr:hypothetical protein PRIPAC_84620 [Pristionchus pacificus]